MKYINDSLKLGTIVEQRIKERDPKQLESAKMDLMERMGRLSVCIPQVCLLSQARC